MSSSAAISYCDAQKLLVQTPDWAVVSESGVLQLKREFGFKDFSSALQFTNALGRLADQHNHHPQIVLEWGKATVSWWTHSADGLLANDFFMASRTDRIYC